MIHEAVESYLLAKNSLKRRNDGMLWVSDLGNHPYKAMARVLGIDLPGFEVSVLNKMQQGNLLEPDTVECLRFGYPNVLTQFPLYNDLWSGYADMVIGHNTMARPTIVEHKGTSDKYFDYKQSLPRSAHVCQLWMYGQLYRARYGHGADLVLYYRSWSNYAEFSLDVSMGRVVATGTVDGAPVARTLWIDPHPLRLELEEYYERQELPSPDGSDSWNYAEDAYERLKI